MGRSAKPSLLVAAVEVQPIKRPEPEPSTIRRILPRRRRRRPRQRPEREHVLGGIAPVLDAEGANGIEGGGALVLLAADQVLPGDRRDVVGHLLVREEEGTRVELVVEAAQLKLLLFRQIGVVEDRHAAVLERVDEIDRLRLIEVGAVGLLPRRLDVVARGRRDRLVLGGIGVGADVGRALVRQVLAQGAVGVLRCVGDVELDLLGWSGAVALVGLKPVCLAALGVDVGTLARVVATALRDHVDDPDDHQQRQQPRRRRSRGSCCAAAQPARASPP